MQQFMISQKFEEGDWDPLFVIDWNCFKSVPEFAVLSPGGLDLDHRAANVRRFKEGVFGGRVERLCAKVLSGEEIISYVSCRVYRGPSGIIDGDLAQPPPPIELPQIEDPGDREYYEWYWNRSAQVKRELRELQTPNIYIQSLCTDPAWQRHGAATMLLKWVFDYAEKERLYRLTLQASHFAVEIGFYEKFGFRVCNKHTFLDKDRFPDREGITVVTMVKDLARDEAQDATPSD